MLNLQRTAMFIAVADTGSFTAAAEAMGLTKAVVSFHIRQLEEELGVTLLLRTTRRLTLTEAGKLFHQRSVMRYGMQSDCRMMFAPTTPG